LGVQWIFIVGPKEVAADLVTLRDMNSRKEERVSLEDALKRVGGS
jgi:histidyl-tRNA synthetase